MKTALSLLAGCILSCSVQAQTQTYDFYINNSTNASGTGPWVSLKCERDHWFSGAGFSGIFKQQPKDTLAYSFSSEEGWFVDDFGTWTCTAVKGFNENDAFRPGTDPSVINFVIPQEEHSVVRLTVDANGNLTAKVQ